MRTVWIINHYAQVPGGPGGTRHFQIAKVLRNLGWNPIVIAASSEHNTGFQRLSPSENSRLDVIDSVPFLWLRTPVSQGNGIRRIFNMLVFSCRLLGPAPRRLLPVPDIIVGSSVHLFAVWSALRLAIRFQIPFVFEVRDLWPQTLIDFGLIKSQSLLARLLRSLEEHLYSRATAIVTLLPFAHCYIQPLGISASKICWIPNGIDLSAWPKTISSPPAGSTLQLMYFGSFGQANALENIVLAMEELMKRGDSPAVHLRLIGDGPLKASLVLMVKDLGIANITFEDPVPKNKIPELAKDADVFLLSLVDSPLYKYGISLNKIYDYMAGARPIIICSSASNNPILEANSGITVPPAAPHALADAIVNISSLSLEERRRMGIAGREYVEANHSSELIGRRFADVLERCLLRHQKAFG